ncbi:hypothetical protein HRI_002290900 [Hibiscus trionum]|uniref:RRM domain-containing protein n=1 Tax=Hibiscus trionum TaxID=183268 RepID=A0A9W7I077_HIBTR|nr:hypothetical protein HRI_002290900 [Hibiscus trionum]
MALGEKEPFQAGAKIGASTVNNEWTVFVDNLSRRVSRSTLRERTSIHGKVICVFIPLINNKAKYKKSTFAFISLASKLDMERVIEKLDGSLIHGLVVKVDKARFPRANKVTKENSSLNQEMKNNSDMRKKGVNTDKCSMESKIFYGPETYREALLSRSIAKNSDRLSQESGDFAKAKVNSLLDFTAPAEDMKWLEKCMVGIIKKNFERDFVQRALQNDGINVKISKWGVDFNSFVILFNSLEEMKEVWSSKQQELCYWFEHIGPLIQNGIPHHFASILLTGVPLFCWHQSFFESLGNRWGSFVALDPLTSTRDRLDIARMVIRLASTATLPTTLKVNSMNVPYIIKVKTGFLDEDDEDSPKDCSATRFTDEWSESDDASNLGCENFAAADILFSANSPVGRTGLLAQESVPHNQVPHLPIMGKLMLALFPVQGILKNEILATV